MKNLLIIAIALLSANASYAADGWGNETEVALVTTTGNTETESYSGKQKTTYTEEMNLYSLGGRYLQTKTTGVETARAWDVGARYERALSTHWSVFVGVSAESDQFAGYVQRDNADLGGKYFFIKSEPMNFFSELGYRSVNTYSTAGTHERDNFGRLYAEFTQQVNESLSYRLWVEYLPNFTREAAYLANAEPSVSVMLSSIFSLKTAYLVKYRNEIAAGQKYADTTFTTSIVAKF